MRVLVLSNLYPPYHEGGYELSCAEMTGYLREQHHEVYVVTGNRGMSDAPDKPENIRTGDVLRIYRFIDYQQGSIRQKHLVEKHNYAVTKRVINAVKPDIIYIWNMKGISIAPVIAVQKSGLPRYFDVGDIWLYVYQRPGLANALKRFFKKLLPFTIGGDVQLEPARVIAGWMKQEIRKTLGCEKVDVIPRGIHLPPDQSEKHRSTRFMITFIGRIEPLKGLDLCLKALHQLKTNAPELNYSFSVYGDEDRDYGRQCRELVKTFGISERVSFYGRIADTGTALRDTDLLLMPTLAREAFGRVIAEAMAHRCIVIATEGFGPSEIITDGLDGFLVPRADAAALADKISCVANLNDTAFAEMGAAARRTVEQRFNADIVNKAVMEKLEYYASAKPQRLAG